MPSRRRTVVVTLVALLVAVDLAALAWRWRPLRTVDWADINANDWVTATHDYSGTRYALGTGVTPANAAQLRLHCSFEVGETRSFQSNPIVVDGVLFVTTDRMTVAFDGTDCRERWRVQHDSISTALWFANRGAGFAHGLVIRGTAAGDLVAMEASSGAIRWQRRIANAAIGEVLTMPPLVVEDLVLIGPAGNENAIAGWVGAFRVRDGTEVWKFRTFVDTVPRDPPVGGGAVWTPMSADTATHTLYLAAGNPAPDYAAHVRPSDTRYTNSLIALDYRTGALRWARQLIPNDTHDWDLTQAGPILDRRIIAAGKDGIVRALDRASGAVLWETPVSRQENGAAPITHEGTFVCPGTYGGVAYNGAAYDPGTGTLYVPSVERCGRYVLSRTVRRDAPALYFGGVFDAGSNTWGGRLTAIDAATGRIRWRYESALPMLAAVTATAGGIVFTGELGGDFLALDASTGRVLARIPTGSAMGGGVVTYSADGRQYVAALTGAATNFLPLPITRNARVVVFALPR